ncbi:MAG: hypothetical protein HRT47_13080 [Candidatus Caenarcaniphilales bacterium]|nr:hypothetical protein [Candidatus Caenarcaniphilales bacterium]
MPDIASKSFDTVIKLGIDNVKKALTLISHPEKTSYYIHIAGTNGKGSVSRFLELFYLKFTDLKIGRYTSPHLKSVCERFRVNGEMIAEKVFQDTWNNLFEDSQAAIAKTNLKEDLTEFEKLTILGFEVFKEANVDLVLLEVGLGGRLDATNVISPMNALATTITSIGFDHMDRLGNTLEKIRAEKEGIKKVSVPHFELSEEEKNPNINPNSPFGDNINLAIKIFEHLTNIKIEDKHRYEFFADFKKAYRGRLEFDQEQNTIFDSAHNSNASIVLNKFIREVEENNNFKRKIYLLSYLSDKNYKDCLEELLKYNFKPGHDQVIFTEVDSERKQGAELLKNYLLSRFNLSLNDSSIQAIKKPDTAFKAAKDLQSSEDLIVVAGSVYLLGDLLSA